MKSSRNLLFKSSRSRFAGYSQFSPQYPDFCFENGWLHCSVLHCCQAVCILLCVFSYLTIDCAGGLYCPVGVLVFFELPLYHPNCDLVFQSYNFQHVPPGTRSICGFFNLILVKHQLGE